ncbi:MAG: family 78 glycoside hydrolase catalytic domain [Clostridia bacterium]|nr:family 78 glycoside hydrolase catalytic domain [Clostridia bacterium]
MPFKSISFIKADVEFVRDFSIENYAPVFRKKFVVTNAENARLYVCGLGYGYYYINGKKVSDDLFTAPPSDYNKTLWFNEYDVTHLIKNGENTIAVMCGNGWYNETIPTQWKFNEAAWRDNPKFILKLEVNGETVVESDESWKCSQRSAVLFNQLRMGEYYDANICSEDWIMPDFDDSSWQNAVKDLSSPGGIFRRCECEPIREHESYKPVKIIKNSDSSYLFDFGQNMSGYIRLTTRAGKGNEFVIRYAECIDEENQLAYYGMDTYYCKSGFQTDKFISSGKEMTWSPRFAYHGFRYAEISGIKRIEDVDVSAVFVHQMINRRTEFECSDEYLNKMFRCGIMSSWSNMFYMPTDCPTREKFAWTNDAQSSCEQFLTNFETERMLEKWHQDIKDAMKKNGELPGIIPTAGWGYHWGNGPVSDGILFEIPYRIYLHTGDSRLLVESMDYFERYLSYLEERKSENGLVEFGLDDWAAPGLIHIVEVGFINAVLMSSFYNIASLAATLSGNEKASFYLSKAEELKNFVKERYIAPDGRCTINEQCSVSMLIYYDIYKDLKPLKAQLKKLIEENNFHLKCGMVGMRRLLHALSKCHLTDYALKLLKAEGYPGYKVWMDGDATTLWEKWDVNVMSDSKNHHMYSDFMSWMIKTLAGVRINEEKCGELEFVLEPHFTKEISFVSFKYNTVCGKIEVSWKRENDRIIMTVYKNDEVKLLFKDEYIQKNITKYEI